MKKILVVALTNVLAAGMAFADGKSGKGDSSTTTTTSTGSANSSSAGRPSGNGTAPIARHYPTNVPRGVPTNINPNARVLRSVDRAELLARQAAFYNRSRRNPVQSTDQNTTGQVSNAGAKVDLSDQGGVRTRRHRDVENNVQRHRNNEPNGNQTGDGGRPIPATNTPPHSKRPVLNFNNSNTMSFADACRRHRNHHDRDWWRNHCTTIILIGGGFYAWDLGYWYPAWGYDNYYSNYAYDGPIYGYDGLPPDQIIANVQYALQQLGYFSEAVDGVLGPVTRAAIEDYQVENDLPVTGAIDRPLLLSLGFIR